MNNKLYQKIIFLISIIAFFLFSYALMIHKVLPIKYRLIFMGTMLLVYLGFSILIFKNSISKILKNIATIFLIFMAVFFLVGFRYLDKGVRTFNNISLSKKKMAYEFSIIVRNKSDIDNIEEIGDKKIIVAYNNDHKNINLFKNEIVKKENKKFEYDSGDSYLSIAEGLLDEKFDIILLNESFRSTIDEKFPKFSKETRVIYSLGLEEEDVNSLKAKEVSVGEPFNLYISGTDSYGKVDMVGRSDVNLLLSVDPKNRRILMTTIPRDSYLRIAGDGYDEYDKFTHSGIYGIASSIETLERTFDTTINYYIKVNFSSLINIVDAMDYVDVVNLQGFKPVFSDEYYPRGILRVNGKQALHFARERKALDGGDNSRGKNHMRLLEAMIKKATSPSIILNYDDLLDVSVNSMDTNIPYSTIMGLVNDQIDSDKDWKIIKEDLKGEGVLGLPSFAMPGYELWMFQPYEESIEEITENIKMFQEGKDPIAERKLMQEQNQTANQAQEGSTIGIENPQTSGSDSQVVDDTNETLANDNTDNDGINQVQKPVIKEEKTEEEIIKELKLVYPVPYNFQDIDQETNQDETQAGSLAE